jgi:hypothetical protein
MRLQLSSPVKDMKKMEHIKSMARSHVQFYALKTLKKQVERLEYDERVSNSQSNHHTLYSAAPSSTKSLPPSLPPSSFMHTKMMSIAMLK